jgi:hypothetical protein
LASGSFSLLKLVRISLGVSLAYGRCSPGFSSSPGVSFFVLRAPCSDLGRCGTSTASSALPGFLVRDLFCVRSIFRSSAAVFLPLASPRRAPRLYAAAWLLGFASRPALAGSRLAFGLAALCAALASACYAPSLRDRPLRACGSPPL